MEISRVIFLRPHIAATVVFVIVWLSCAGYWFNQYMKSGWIFVSQREVTHSIHRDFVLPIKEMQSEKPAQYTDTYSFVYQVNELQHPVFPDHPRTVLVELDRIERSSDTRRDQLAPQNEQIDLDSIPAAVRDLYELRWRLWHKSLLDYAPGVRVLGGESLHTIKPDRSSTGGSLVQLWDSKSIVRLLVRVCFGPAILIAFATAVVMFLVYAKMIDRLIRSSRLKKHRCPDCDYPLEGAFCSECGSSYTPGWLKDMLNR